MFNLELARLKPILFFAFWLILFNIDVYAEEVFSGELSTSKIKIHNTNTRSHVTRIEPPFWWENMHDKRLQLMIYGKNIGTYNVNTTSHQWKIDSVEHTDNHNYLFINLIVSQDAVAGDYDLQLLKNDQLIETIQYQLKTRRLNSKLRQGFNASDAIYLITPDRFANGDYENDETDELKDKIDLNNENGRHGGDIQGIINHLDYIAELGFTQIWINPLLENDQATNSYHGYSTTDYYQIDKRFGDNLLYKELTKQARKKGLGVIKDVILNHIGSEHWWINDLPSKDWINNGAKFKPTSHRRETLQDPYGTLEDRNDFTQGWFVPTMPDLNQKNQLLANYIIQNNIWWIEYADLSGIRVDTLSYSNKDFLTEYTDRIMKEYPDFNIVGEEWSVNPNIVAYWQQGKQRHDDYQIKLPSLMDFPLNNTLTKSLNEKENWTDGLQKLYELLATDYVYFDPNKLVIFPDNHDMSRIYTQLDHDEALTKMAIAFYATSRGIPQFYYGSEIFMKNEGTDSHGVIRTNFPGGWKGDEKSAFSGNGLSYSQQLMQEYFRKLLHWRKQASAIHNGKLTHYVPKKGVYVYFRHSEKEKIMVVMNKNDSRIKINPDDYTSMLSATEKNSTAFDVIQQVKISLRKPFFVAPKSVLILEL